MANHNHHKTMTSFAMEVAEHVFDCSDYCQSVLDHADHWGFLSEADASKLLKDHGTSFWQVMDEGLEMHHLRHAQALLIHLGY